ncbi:hypothetical protein BLSTO_01492 [Blastocystis sp. subtype 1]
MRLTSDVITNARAYYNALKQRELDIRGIRIPVMENLGAAQNQFDVIDLSDNSITKIENIPKFDRLNTLLLTNLSLIDNPIVVEKDFRARVVAILPQLTVLNFQRVTQKDREAAKQYMTSE